VTNLAIPWGLSGFSLLTLSIHIHGRWSPVD
jgi:hypothetical protein